MATDEQIYQALLDSMTPTDDVILPFRGMLYGESGVGKTVLAMQIAQAITPPDKEILFIDHRTGFSVIKQNPRWRDSLGKRTRRMQYKGLSQLSQVALSVRSDRPEFQRFGCLILDEVTAMSESDAEIVLKKAVEKDTDKDPDLLEWPQYNAEKARFSRIVNILTSVPIHVILVGHEREDKRNGISVVDVGFIPSLAAPVKRDLALNARITAQLDRSSDPTNPNPAYIRTAQVQPTTTVSAKTRIEGLPVKISASKLVKVVKEYSLGHIKDVEPITEPQQDIKTPTDDQVMFKVED